MRVVIALLVGLVVGMAAYFFVDSNQSGAADRAREAVTRTGETLKSQGISGAVKAALVADFGLQQARFLHAWVDDGKVVIYGLLPGSLDAAEVQQSAEGVPGVEQVQLFVQPLPETLQSAVGEAQTGDQPPPENGDAGAEMPGPEGQ